MFRDFFFTSFILTTESSNYIGITRCSLPPVLNRRSLLVRGRRKDYHRDNTLFTPLSFTSLQSVTVGSERGWGEATPPPSGRSGEALKKAATLSGDSFHSVITSAHVRERH